MKLDALFLVSGLLPENDRVLADDERDALEVAACDFLRAGGSVSMVEFAALSPDSRAALTIASSTLRDEHCERMLQYVAEAIGMDPKSSADAAAEALAGEVMP